MIAGTSRLLTRSSATLSLAKKIRFSLLFTLILENIFLRRRYELTNVSDRVKLFKNILGIFNKISDDRSSNTDLNIENNPVTYPGCSQTDKPSRLLK